MSASTVIQAVVKMVQAAVKFLKPLVIASMLAAAEALAASLFSSANDWFTEMKEKKADKGFEDEGFRGSVAA